MKWPIFAISIVCLLVIGICGFSIGSNLQEFPMQTTRMLLADPPDDDDIDPPDDPFVNRPIPPDMVIFGPYGKPVVIILK